jgi:hypothetical protein
MRCKYGWNGRNRICDLAVLELHSACFELYRPVPENTYPYHATGVDSVRLSLPVSASS